MGGQHLPFPNTHTHTHTLALPFLIKDMDSFRGTYRHAHTNKDTLTHTHRYTFGRSHSSTCATVPRPLVHPRTNTHTHTYTGTRRSSTGMAENTVPWRTLNGRSEATAKESNDVSIATEKWYRSAGTISAHGVEINAFRRLCWVYYDGLRRVVKHWKE